MLAGPTLLFLPYSRVFSLTLKPLIAMAGPRGSKATNTASAPPGSGGSCMSWDTPASQLHSFPIPSLYLSRVRPCPWMPSLDCLHLLSDTAGGWFNSLTWQKSPPSNTKQNKTKKENKKCRSILPQACPPQLCLVQLWRPFSCFWWIQSATLFPVCAFISAVTECHCCPSVPQKSLL